MIVLQIVLKMILYLLLFLLILCGIVCLSSVAVKISFWDKKFTWSVCYFGFQIIPFRKKKKSGKKKEQKIPKISEKFQKIKNPENSENSETLKNPDQPEEAETLDKPENSENPENSEKKAVFKMDQKLKSWQKFVSRMDMAGSACAALPGTIRIFAGALQWCDIQTDIIIGGEDAYESARNYGILQATVQNLLAQTSIFIKVRRKDIRIACDFTQDESIYQFRCAFRLHIGLTILAVLYFVVAYFWDKFRMKSAIVNPKI